jgi:hypothetical protein
MLLETLNVLALIIACMKFVFLMVWNVKTVILCCVCLIEHCQCNSFINMNLIHSFTNYIRLSFSTCSERHPLILRRSVMQTVYVCSHWYRPCFVVPVGCIVFVQFYFDLLVREYLFCLFSNACQWLHTYTIYIIDLLRMSGWRSKHVEELYFI